jgi:hypothetical protein
VFRWAFARDVTDVVLRQIENVDLGSMLYSVGSVRKVVTFRKDGGYVAETTYDRLQDRFPGDSVKIPIKVGDRSRKQIVATVEYQKPNGKWVPVAEDQISWVHTGVAWNAYVSVPRSADGSATFRLVRKGKFDLSLGATEKNYRYQKRDRPHSWNRHIDAYEATKHCSDVSMIVRLPLSVIGARYEPEKDVRFGIWSSAYDSGHLQIVEDDRSFAKIVGGRAATYGLTSNRTRHHLELHLDLRGPIPLGKHYAIVWKPPMV